MRSAYDRHLSRAYYLLLLCSCRAIVDLRAALRWSKTTAQDPCSLTSPHLPTAKKTPILTSSIAQESTVLQPVNGPLSLVKKNLLLPASWG
ncbi:unnamed protein product [Ectocarpus sp. 13 AM-2016]